MLGRESACAMLYSHCQRSDQWEPEGQNSMAMCSEAYQPGPVTSGASCQFATLREMIRYRECEHWTELARWRHQNSMAWFVDWTKYQTRR